MTARRLLLIALTLLAACAIAAAPAVADEEATWRLEQPKTPPPPAGVPEAKVPIGLGKVGDIEFWAPNRGLLITAGNAETIPPGLWAYNGKEWHELSNVCGATDGRIAWAGPEEFWTVSDGRPGQAGESAEGGGIPPLEDNTLCHFSDGQVVASYAHPAFQADSYEAMHAAGCITATDCWFAGDPLLEPQIGAFQLHWNGNSVETEPYPGEGHAIEDMRLFEGHLYESVRLSKGDHETEPLAEPPVVHRINPERVTPTFEPEESIPLYGPGEEPTELDFLHLSAGEGAFWAAGGAARETGPGVTVDLRSEGVWTQLIGPDSHPSGEELFPNERPSAIAAEPGSGGAWLALEPRQPGAVAAKALVARISADGAVSDPQALPSRQEEDEGVGPKGAAAKLACPAVNDCWLVTTDGWLFHLTTPATRLAEQDNPDTAAAFSGLITFRPHDLGLPQVPPDAPPEDDSGLVEAPPSYGGAFAESASAERESRVALPLLSDLHSRLVHGTTLELRFHLVVKARLRLIAMRKKQVVASTATRTLAAGARKLLLRLDRRRWPTKLNLQTRALAPLPTVSSRSSAVSTETTGLVVLPRVPSLAGLGQLP
jgi:hypothetical protein